MDAVFGIEIDALIAGEFKPDDGWAAPLPSATQFPACPDCGGDLAVFDRRYHGGDPWPDAGDMDVMWGCGSHYTVVPGVGVSNWLRRGRYAVGRLRAVHDTKPPLIADEPCDWEWPVTGVPS